MPADHQTGNSGFTGIASRVITVWALLGGGVLLAVVAVNMMSILGSMFGKPLPGDFELTEMGVAVAVFAFLPYCQLTGANVSADIFTAGASKRLIAFFTLLGSLVALGFASLLIWRMFHGMLDQREYGYTTTILQIPHWMAFVPILVSLVLLALAALVTLMRDTSALSKG
ncbi:TRAP transporter small permease [Roseibium alexandrii]|uniref:TRAP transporter small permease protein n=1 Tax=Roseibium alexandrii (strain DSM 17067 / NCIMB 14079 / DFL-11) TaxID=244592 RepID=A0A5E8H705_ROSAD|nr:TRAP transporter small permease [Roseibium alexandrii]EEE47861.1 TRAP-type C4-dicarboxylate transport system, small permease component [Roseibium alexandrii DFL-11]